MGVNSYQVNGDHYMHDYQPWDFILDNDIGFLAGNAIKYIVRHRKKGGVNDLRKCIHYLHKIKSSGWKISKNINQRELHRFTKQLKYIADISIIYNICAGNIDNAIIKINNLISVTMSENDGLKSVQ